MPLALVVFISREVNDFSSLGYWAKVFNASIFSNRDITKYGGCSLTVECQLVALKTWVQLPPSAFRWAYFRALQKL